MYHKNTINTTTMKTKKSYDFPVSLAEVKTNNIIIPNKLAVIREDTQQPIGLVSNQYSLVKHSDAIDCFRDALKGNEYEEKIELTKNGAQLFGLYTLNSVQIQVDKNDLVALQLIIKNSYDGTKSLQLVLGAFRLVCSNGMIIGKELFNFSQKHFSSNLPEISNLKDNVSKMVNTFKDTLPLMQKMNKTSLKINEDLFNNKKVGIPQYLLKEAKEEYKNKDMNTIWGYYNSLTYAISHKMKKETPNTQFYYLERAWEKSLTLIK